MDSGYFRMENYDNILCLIQSRALRKLGEMDAVERGRLRACRCPRLRVWLYRVRADFCMIFTVGLFVVVGVAHTPTVVCQMCSNCPSLLVLMLDVSGSARRAHAFMCCNSSALSLPRSPGWTKHLSIVADDDHQPALPGVRGASEGKVGEASGHGQGRQRRHVRRRKV